MMYYAHTLNPDGRLRGAFAFAKTRDETVRRVFALDPRAYECLSSTARHERNGKLRGTGHGMKWHRNEG